MCPAHRLLLPLMLIGACATSAPHPELGRAERLGVELKPQRLVGDSLRFGDYQARGLDWSWLDGVERSRVSLEGADKGLVAYKFQFSQGGRETWTTRCLTASRDTRALPMGARWYSGSAALSCTFQHSGRDLHGSLLLAPSGWTLEKSRAVLGPAVLELEPVWDKTNAVASYYRISWHGHPVGIVDPRADDGEVWIARGLDKDTRMAVAISASTLLLFEDLL